MTRISSAFIVVLAGVMGLIVLLFVFDIGRSSIYGSPEDVFNASKAALKQNDLRTWCDCLTDDSRDLIVASELVHAMSLSQIPPQMMKDNQKVQLKAVVSVMTNHGYTDAFLAERQGMVKMFGDKKTRPSDRLKIAQLLLEPVSDRNALFEQINKALSGGSKENPFAQWRDAKLTEVRVAGNQAVGSVVFIEDGEESRQDLLFRKVRDKWKIDMFPISDGLPPGHP